MIDFIKLKISRDFWNEIQGQLQGRISAKFDPVDGSTILYEVHQFENFTVTLFSKHIEIAGSIHTFHNRINGISDDNRDDFSYEDFCHAVEQFELLLGIELRFEKLIQLEVGVNLKVDFHVKNFLRQNVLMWNFDRPIVDQDKKGKGQFKEFETSQFYVKTYDKGRHVGLKYEEMRFELKYVRSAYLRALGIHNLSDLMDRAKFEILARDLFQRFDKDLLIVDTVDVSFIKDKKDRELLTKGMNHVYWERLSTEPSRYSKLKQPINPTTVSRRKSRYRHLLDVYGLMNGKALVMALLRDKIIELFGVDVSVKRKVHNVSLIPR